MQDESHAAPAESRRGFLLAGVAMTGGLAAGYGAFGAIAARFLYPSAAPDRIWVFVATLQQIKKGESVLFRAPDGAPVNITRRGDAGTADDFLALSSTCPHLGCQVHWESDKNRYFCPCHNGVFDPVGHGIGGPPGDAGQSLKQFPLRVENGLLFLETAAPSAGGKRA